MFRKMEAAHSKRNPTDEAELDAEFHLAIIEAIGSTAATSVLPSFVS